MRSNTKEPKDFGDIADDARALMEATANVTGLKVENARKRLALALKHGKSSVEDMADASADMATDNYQELRHRISVGLTHGKEIYDKVHDDVICRTKAADHTVRENPYRTMGIALGVGTIVGYMISSRHSRNGH